MFHQFSHKGSLSQVAMIVSFVIPRFLQVVNRVIGAYKFVRPSHPIHEQKPANNSLTMLTGKFLIYPP